MADDLDASSIFSSYIASEIRNLGIGLILVVAVFGAVAAVEYWAVKKQDKDGKLQ